MKMDGCFSFEQIKAIQKLVTPPENNSDSEDDLPQSEVKKLGPGDIKSLESHSNYTNPRTVLTDESSDIWHSSESIQNEISEDPRLTPKYEMKFKQSVRTEDVFFGMGFKTPSTASCEWLTVSVQLPQENYDKIKLSVESNKIDLRSPRYRLHLPTAFPVEPNASSAKWHADTCTLEITLKLNRELDELNF